MNTKHRVMLVAGVSVFVLGLVLFGSAVSWYNDAIKLEEATRAQYNNNRNEYDSFWKKVKETAQVPDKYKDDFKDLLVAETEAKFGPEGSKATFQWFKDRDIKFSDQLYLKVQDVIESGRNDFKRGQTELLDKQRTYNVHVKSFWGRMWASWYNMPNQMHGDLAPTRDLDGDGKLTVLDYPIVTSKRTERAFATGEDEAVQVFDKK